MCAVDLRIAADRLQQVYRQYCDKIKPGSDHCVGLFRLSAPVWLLMQTAQTNGFIDWTATCSVGILSMPHRDLKTLGIGYRIRAGIQNGVSGTTARIDRYLALGTSDIRQARQHDNMAKHLKA